MLERCYLTFDGTPNTMYLMWCVCNVCMYVLCAQCIDMMVFYNVNMTVATIYSSISRFSCLGVTKRWIVLVSIPDDKKTTLSIELKGENSNISGTFYSLSFSLSHFLSIVRCFFIGFHFFISLPTAHTHTHSHSNSQNNSSVQLFCLNSFSGCFKKWMHAWIDLHMITHHLPNI